MHLSFFFFVTDHVTQDHTEHCNGNETECVYVEQNIHA